MPTKKQFADALRNAKLSEPQRRALQEVYLQPNHQCTAPKLAALLGYKDFIGANGVFGKAARAIGEYLEYCPEPQWIYVISSWDRIARTWTLHANFAAAMTEHLKSTDLRPQVDPDEIDLVSAAGRVPTMTNRIKRDTALVGKIKKLHDYKCQICGHKIELTDGDRYAQVHHIQPLGGEHSGTDVMENMLCVCPNHHVQLDYCAIRLDLSQLRILPGHLVAARFVEYHNERVQR